MFTGEDCGKFRYFIALLYLCLIDHPREFPNKQVKLQYTFSRLEGAMLEQLIDIMKDNYINLGNFEAFVTLVEEAYGNLNHVNTTERGLTKLYQGNRDFIMYYTEFQCLIADLNWNDAANHAALHHGLCEDLKAILSI
jgi:hypothetical protein